MKRNKTILKGLLLLTALLLLGNCSVDSSLQQGNVVFGIQQALAKSINNPDDISAIILTVQDTSTGDIIMNQNKMSVYRVNSSFLTESINLSTGSYSITELLVVDNADNTLFLSPLEGSDKADLVSNPLPVDFSISADLTTNIKPEVLSLHSNDTPLDYGYATFGFDIVTEPKNWDTVVDINGSEGLSYTPKVVIDEFGRKFIVWKQKNGTLINLWARRYTPQAGWDTAVLVETNNIADVKDFDVCIDDNGNAIVLWLQNDGNDDKIWGREYIKGTGWNTVKSLITHSGSYVNFTTDADELGRFVAAWVGGKSVYSVTFSKAEGWGIAQTIYTNSSYSSRNTDLDINRNGKGFLIWQVQNSGIYSLPYSAGSTTEWGSAQSVYANSTSYELKPSIAVDPRGNATAAFRYYYSSSSCYAYAKCYKTGLGWDSELKTLGSSVSSVTVPKVKMDSYGNSTIVWRTSARDIYAAHYDVEFGWQSNRLVTDDSSTDPVFALDLFGNAMVIWGGIQDSTSKNGVLASYLTSTGNWTTPELLVETVCTDLISLSENYSGDVAIAWTRGVNSISNYVQTLTYK